MSLVDLVEQMGAQVDAGTIDHADAVQRIMEYSDGGLTRLGAEDSLDNWRTLRGQYEGIFNHAAQARDALRREHPEW